MTTIRRATAHDAADLADLAERTFREAFAADNQPSNLDDHCARSFGTGIQRREIADPDMVTILAEDHGQLIAFAQVRLLAPKACVQAQHPCELYRIYVSSPWHGQGVAHQLMHAVLAVVSDAGGDCVWLGVWEHNPRAIAFYAKFGFETVGEHVFQFGDEAQRDLILAAWPGPSSHE
jgi:ribosomal protein S18 acetylase RimI-like enzyme